MGRVKTIIRDLGLEIEEEHEDEEPWSRRANFGAVEAALRACEAEKRALPIARQIQNEGRNS